MKYIKVVFKSMIFILCMYIITMPFGWYITKNMKTEVESIQKTMTEARASAYEIELTGVTQLVMGQNKDLAKMQNISQYKLFKYHVVKGFQDLQPIK